MDLTRFPGGGLAPIGSLTGGLLDRLERAGGCGSVSDHRRPSLSGTEFASTVERAAAGLSRRGLRPDDVVAVLAPVSTARLISVYTAMAVGGVALPLELTSDIDTLIGVLVETDARLIMVTPELAHLALDLSERSRVRQVISFGAVPETTSFSELLRPPGDRGGYDPAHVLFNSGLIGYAAVPGEAPRTVTHPYRELAWHFRHLDTGLGLSRHDTVALENGMTEFDRSVLAAAALWNGASVVALSTDDEAETRAALRSHGATVRGAPVPTRIGPPRR
ncbi:AMP-binding protein [Actinorugispora endophytica]|uniref:AMP-binding enzyme n=1 Tax=Actinorugispora endophytica TaxID=1605990 RepID=A0A4R6V1E7_9ACTN|nr:AMP-binding protein [Actinorugispora endophytica]TDQ53811.1 AMP-binding enzyme [Actinorugispora endophytica]